MGGKEIPGYRLEGSDKSYWLGDIGVSSPHHNSLDIVDFSYIPMQEKNKDLHLPFWNQKTARG
jgi:hypothetical protein